MMVQKEHSEGVDMGKIRDLYDHDTCAMDFVAGQKQISGSLLHHSLDVKYRTLRAFNFIAPSNLKV